MRKAQFSVEYDIARNRSEFLEKLPRFSPDIILADYALPDITGIEAIAFCRETGVEAPVILITGDGNETIAVDSLRRGAIDYILKKNITGLPARVDRAIEIWEDRKANERAEAEEIRLQQLLSENQKMEAIGRLAGGIAHDFNKPLARARTSAESQRARAASYALWRYRESPLASRESGRETTRERSAPESRGPSSAGVHATARQAHQAHAKRHTAVTSP